MLKIVHGIILPPYIKNNISKETLDSWMILYNRGSYIGSSTAYNGLDLKIYGISVDDILEHYKDLDVDYLLVSWFGAYCHDFWKWHNDCISYIETLDSNDDNWVLAGQIISKEHQKKNEQYKDQFYPYPISAIINLKTWREIGCPQWEDNTMDLYHVPQMSKECIHDDYTPLVLNPTRYKTIIKNAESGNSFISKILDNNIPIHNIPVNIRKNIIHTYPENDPIQWNHTMEAYMKLPMIQDNKHYEFMKHALQYKNIRHAPDYSPGVFFLYNTEEVFPKKFINESTSALQITDTIIGPCSMFKAFILGSQSDTVNNYIHFDIFERNVLWKRIITENWNGEYDNLLEVLSNLPNNEEYGFWTRDSDNIVEKQYNILLNQFGSAENLKENWQNYKNKNHEYVKANLLFDDKNILQALDRVESNIVYTAIGDIPGYMINGINYGIHNITRYTIKHLDKLKSRSEYVYVDIKNPITDIQVFGEYDSIVSELAMTIERVIYP